MIASFSLQFLNCFEKFTKRDDNISQNNDSLHQNFFKRRSEFFLCPNYFKTIYIPNDMMNFDLYLVIFW